MAYLQLISMNRISLSKVFSLALLILTVSSQFFPQLPSNMFNNLGGNGEVFNPLLGVLGNQNRGSYLNFGSPTSSMFPTFPQINTNRPQQQPNQLIDRRNEKPQNGNQILQNFDQFQGLPNTPTKTTNIFGGLPQNPFDNQNPGKSNQNKKYENLGQIRRDIMGRFNNQKNQNFGAQNSEIERKGNANYKDGRMQMIDGPNPRVVSNIVGNVEDNQIPFNQFGFTIALTFWGQFMDHDLDLIKDGQGQSVPIKIPPSDPFITNQTQIPFERSRHEDRNNRPRVFRNDITSWIDASNVYGSTTEISNKIRLFKDGKLKTTRNGELLPQENGFFVAGDQRVNENIFLTAYHTLFVKEHNRKCDQIISQTNNLSDQQVYQAARHFVIGMLQKITLEDFLPELLGRQNFNRYVGKYSGYDQSVNPNIPIQFASAAFRIGHPLLVSDHPIINKNGKTIENFNLKDLFVAPKIFKRLKIGDIFRGISSSLNKQRNHLIVSGVRNFLIQMGRNETLFDLFALNVQRGRDHGLPFYNDARKAFGLRPYNNFMQFAENNRDLANRLERAYGNINKMQLWVGIISEPQINQAVTGQLGAAIIGTTFANVRNGDRFWYENAYPPEVIKQIKATSLGQIVRRNSQGEGQNIQDNIFKTQSFGFPTNQQQFSPSNFNPPSPSNFNPPSPSNFNPPSPSNFNPPSPSNFNPSSPSNFKLPSIDPSNFLSRFSSSSQPFRNLQPFNFLGGRYL